MAVISLDRFLSLCEPAAGEQAHLTLCQRVKTQRAAARYELRARAPQEGKYVYWIVHGVCESGGRLFQTVHLCVSTIFCSFAKLPATAW